MRISPHLCFDGQCRLAFENYQRLLGGTIATMLTYGDSPLAAQVAPQWHGHIVHATLQMDGMELTGADIAGADYRKPQGFFVTLTIEGLERARDVFHALALGGEIGLGFQKTFWSPGFGVVTDKFGIPWEINSAQTATSA